MKGKVVSINRSDKKGVVKNPIPEGRFIEGFGLEDDAHGGNWHRQVSLLGKESVEKMEKLIKQYGKAENCLGIF